MMEASETGIKAVKKRVSQLIAGDKVAQPEGKFYTCLENTRSYACQVQTSDDEVKFIEWTEDDGNPAVLILVDNPVAAEKALKPKPTRGEVAQALKDISARISDLPDRENAGEYAPEFWTSDMDRRMGEAFGQVSTVLHEVEEAVQEVTPNEER
jgi:hypothetical protein